MPSVPEGEKLDFGSREFREFEEIGECGVPPGVSADKLLHAIMKAAWRGEQFCSILLLVLLQVWKRAGKQLLCWWRAAWGSAWATPASKLRCPQT